MFNPDTLKEATDRDLAGEIVERASKGTLDETVKSEMMVVLAILGTIAEGARAEVKGTLSDTPVPEAAAEKPILTRFNEQYEHWSAEHKAKMPWEKVQERLLANNSHYLNLASAMNEGGVLFGIDIEGNPLVADDGFGAIMCGMKYADTREAVYFTKDAKGEKTSTGYEMFPATISEDHPFSPEVLAFMAFTGREFVMSDDGELGWAREASWLESDHIAIGRDWPRYIHRSLACGATVVDKDNSINSDPKRGARRLLRVKA